MSRQPTISTDSVAQDQIRAFVDRILRMKEEAKAINDDIREIYAEAKGNGFDKTVLGKLVSYVGKREKSAAAMEEADALFDIYLAAYDGTPSRTHAHAREDEPATHAAADGEGGGEDAPASLAEPIRQDDPADAVVGGTQPADDRSHSEPGNGQTGETPVVATRQGGEEPGTLGSLSAAPSNIVRIQAKPLRPYCQHLDDLTKCGGYGKQHCGECLRARDKQIDVVPGGVDIAHHGTVRA